MMEKLKTNELSLGLNQTLRNDLVDNFEKIQKGVDGQADSLNKQILDMLGNVAPQDQNEVTQARIDVNGKSYDTLKGREDATQLTAETALLEERDTSVEVQNARTNSSSQTYPTLKERMDSQENDLNNSINDKLAQISAVPETFTNLDALKNVYPNGKTGIFVTADTGHKYIWANNGWNDAGVYQSVGIANDSLTSDMLSGSMKNASLYVNIPSGDGVFDISSTNKTLTTKNVYLNYGGHSNLISDATLQLGNPSNVLYYDFTTLVLGVTDYVWKLTTTQAFLGIINNDLSVISLKATAYSIDGVPVKPYVREKFINHNVYAFGDAVIDLDKKMLYINSIWINYDYGAGKSVTNVELDVSNNAIVYFDLKDGKVKNTGYYGDLKDSHIILGNFQAGWIQGSFFNHFSRVLVRKNGITYNAEEYKARNAILTGAYMATFGDSITSDQVSGTGTQIMNALGAKKTGNFATGWSTGSDWHDGTNNTTTVTLTTPNNTDTNDNVLSNQVRRALQYTTASGQQITWTHPVDGTFSLDTALGTGLGNTDKLPSVIYIAISTNDGKNASVPIVDDTDAVLAQNYKDLTRNSLASGLRWAIETLQSAYPGVKIFVASPLQARGSAWMNYTNGNIKRDIIKKVAKFTSVYFIDSFSESGFSHMTVPTWTDDGVHPSTLGKPKLVDYVTNEIRKKF
ncbi:SGNH/GDSL hydrolase family protein [Leuconostoc falkenbergense]|uniref:SGNH/GDSL hydrolase family protein n=1 Tax=Leuconostoc falkenbergense TaxID=2766470 RepID=UPI0021A9CE75|nr:SGNH/GDSL hydrolase family protein [Leuconostoc falkenbergense]